MELLMRRDLFASKTITYAAKSGKNRISHGNASIICFRLEFQTIDVVNVRGLSHSIERNDNGETNGDFGCRHRNDKEDENLRIVIRQAARIDAESGKRDKRKIRRIQHQLERHENNDEVSAQNDTGKTDREKQPANEKIIAKCDH